METLLTMKFLILVMLSIGLSAGNDTGSDVQVDLTAVVERLRETAEELSKQMEYQQLAAEERVRSEGSSGIKLVRGRARAFSEPYYGFTYTGLRMGSIHDHSNNNQTCGMGEVIAVMNGVEFRTRHNDYKLVKPGGKDDDFHAIEPIEYPDVPPAVMAKQNVADQVEEMREWFKAWQDQDTSVRDYRPYFKPNLCYMEAGWLVSNSDGLEPFASDRHHIDAKTFQELMDKIKYTGYTGGKSRQENLAYLPRKIHSIADDGTIRFEQWNYRILCHPLKTAVPLDAFHLEDDKVAQRINDVEQKDMMTERSARFVLTIDETRRPYSGAPRGQDSFLDHLMSEIPGKSGYLGNLTDEALGRAARNVNGGTLNAAYYHRFYKMATDAMGKSIRKRGFSDDNLWVAFTDRKEVSPVKVPNFEGVRDKDLEHRVTYAFPLEIVFTTPLQKWNPYNLPYRGIHNSDEGKQAWADGQDGSEEKPYNGTTNNLHYITPATFFRPLGGATDDADTVLTGGAYVRDGTGESKLTMASGIHVVLPNIETLGKLRLRYPISPVHQEGSAIWREHEVTKETLGELENWNEKEVSDALERVEKANTMAALALTMASQKPDTVVIPEVSVSDVQHWVLNPDRNYPEDQAHIHEFNVKKSDIEALLAAKGARSIEVTTEASYGTFPDKHTHKLLLTSNSTGKRIKWTECDETKGKCAGDERDPDDIKNYILSHNRWVERL